MNLKDKVREALLKQTERKYDYGCVMVGLNLKKEEWDVIQKTIDEKDIYFGTEDDKGYGREMDPHVTILYGIHEDVPDEDVEKLIKKIGTPDIQLQKVSSFKNENFEVLKFDIESKDLDKLNKMFKKLPHTSTYPDYHPHATICYLKKGNAEKYVQKLKDIEPLNVTPSEILYSKPDGSKKKYEIK